MMRLINPRDTVRLVYFAHSYNHEVSTAEEKDSIQEYYTKELHEVGPVDSQFSVVEYPANTDLTQALVNYVNDSTADVFAIAPRASRHPSSITEAVVNNVLISVLLCKN